ncbi:trypsin-like peptidase domain-containing protein [Candidatus Electronema sp. JM]|uniref:trypsin-like peptidase domain-containing protein n=1 Tax=Candidatus Electronema sp. JM TaxID=3401571 RepID=UPI003AA8AF54
MAIDKRAIFLLTSADGSKKAFGTGFAVAQQEGKLLLLTCAHVVEQLGGRVIASGEDAVPHEAEIEAVGASNAVDLALLRIAWNGEAPPLLNRPAKGKPELPFQIFGYGPHLGARENYVLRDIRGRLGKPIAFKAVGLKSIEAWDIHVDDDEFSKLQGGYSGSPLCDEAGGLIAVVSHNADPAAGQRGHAVAVSNLKSIYPEIERLIPAFAALRPDAAPADSIARAKKQLRSLLMDFELADSLCDIARSEFKRMEEEGIGSSDEELLEKIGNAAAEAEEWATLVRFLESLDKKSKNAVAGPDYPRLAKQLARGEVILCLGQETSHLLGALLPSTAEIKRHLCQEDFPGPLSELCEQKLIAPESNRKDLVDSLRELLNKKSPAVSLHELLARLDKPFIVISTCYDCLLQESLRARRRSFVEIYPNMEEGKCLLTAADGTASVCTPENVSAHAPLENGQAVIYRLRGGIVGGQEHLLLAERDYFMFNKVMEQQKLFPDYISSRLKSSLCSLWFLGHHPESWEERLLVRFLRDMQHPDASALVVQENSSEFARNFWQAKKVKVHDLALTEFVQNLEAAL